MDKIGPPGNVFPEALGYLEESWQLSVALLILNLGGSQDGLGLCGRFNSVAPSSLCGAGQGETGQQGVFQGEWPSLPLLQMGTMDPILIQINVRGLKRNASTGCRDARLVMVLVITAGP